MIDFLKKIKDYTLYIISMVTGVLFFYAYYQKKRAEKAEQQAKENAELTEAMINHGREINQVREENKKEFEKINEDIKQGKRDHFDNHG